MNKITDTKTFKKVLSSLPLNQQRQVGAHFVSNVLDLTDGKCTKQAQILAEKSDVTPEELEAAYHAVHAVYVSTNPRSDFSELDFSMQAAHFVAEACMTTVGPVYSENRQHHLAGNAASYCRMARMCSAIHHAGDSPNFLLAEKELNKEMEAQYEILNKYLEENS